MENNEQGKKRGGKREIEQTQRNIHKKAKGKHEHEHITRTSPYMNTNIRRRTDVPRPPHTAALGVLGNKTAAAAQLGERGAWKGALPGTGRSLPGEGADQWEGT